MKQYQTMDLIDIYTVFHLMVADYTFFSAADGTFCKIHHMLGQKASINNTKKNQINPLYAKIS
jgi:hypothetical protein